MHVRSWSGVVGLVALVGCTEAEPEEAAEVDEIVIPVQPQTELAIVGTTELLGAGEVSVRAELVLAVGEGYPRELTAAIPEWSLGTDCGYLLGETVLHDVSGTTDAIAARAEAGRLALSIHDAGAADLSIVGELVANGAGGCPVVEGQRVPLTVQLTVRAIRPAGIRFERSPDCGDRPKVAMSAQPEIEVVLLDVRGLPFEAANASADAQATVRLHGSFEASPSDYVAPSLSSWSTAVPGEVALVPDVGDALRIDVVDADAITRAEIEFQLSGMPVSDPIVLQTRAIYGADGWEEAQNRIAPMVQRIEVGDVALCSAPSAEWFELESSTPDVCTVLEDDFAKLSLSFTGLRTGTIARLEQDGTCALVLRAPEFPASAGQAWALAADFLRVDELYE